MWKSCIHRESKVNSMGDWLYGQSSCYFGKFTLEFLKSSSIQFGVAEEITVNVN